MRGRQLGARRGLLVLAILTLAILPTSAGSAFGAPAPACDSAEGVELAPNLVNLQNALGATMGSPVSCAIVDDRGDVIQIMSTGLAMADPSGTAVFASGERHWALNADGLQTWTGNWHDGLYPPPTVAADQDGLPALAGPQPASIEPMTVVRVPGDVSTAVVVQDPDGSMFTVETDSGCPGVGAAPGDHVFVRYSGPRTDLILLQQHETCAVAAMNAAVGD